MRNIISILFLALYFSSEAQLSTSYSMGGISLSDNYNNTFSGPILLKSEKGCLSVANGVEVYKASAARSGLFDLECDYFEESSEPIFVMFPNPAPGYTKIFSSRMLAASEKVSFLIYDSKGLLVQKAQVGAGQLKGGFTLHTLNWPSGFYLIKVLYKTQVSTLKLISSTY